MKNLKELIAGTGARRNFDISVALVSIIPFLSLSLIGGVSFNAFVLSYWQWGVLVVGVVCSPLLGYSVLVQYPATVMKLRIYLDEIVSGEIPDQIDLVRGETDIAAIERAMNLVVERLRDRVDKAEAASFRLQEELLQSRKLEAVGTLAAGIAHEINTPLQFITTNLTFLAHELDYGVQYISGDIATCISESQDGLHRIAGIVRAMSVFAQCGDDGVMKRININAAIESVVEVSRSVWKCAARCDLDLDPMLPEVTCFPGEIKQAFMNIMINAVDAIKLKRAAGADETLGRVSIHTHSGDDTIVVTISDTGGGISPEIRKRMFEPFFTTDKTRSHHGQGLTLAYASVVRRHGGELSFESTDDGALFRVQLPTCPAQCNQKGTDDE